MKEMHCIKMITAKARVTKYGALLGLFTMGATIGQAPLAAPSKPAPKRIAWRSSLSVALQEAKRTKKPIMVELGAKWCSPCRAMEARTYTQDVVVRESRKWIPVKVDIDAHPEIADRYGLQTPPMVAFLKSDGTLVSKFVGYADASATVKQMKLAYAKAHPSSKAHSKSPQVKRGTRSKSMRARSQ